MIGDPAPLFDLDVLNGESSLALADLQGKFVVMHFGTSW